MKIILDPDGQPPEELTLGRRITRGIHEMLGICKGVLIDGVVSEAEADYLNEWILANPEVALEWPGDVLARRLRDIYADGFVGEREKLDLAELLRDIVGGQINVVVSHTISTTLPLTTPPPQIDFEGRQFVFTGKFAFGPRQECEQVVRELGGTCRGGITQKTDFVVIGSFASQAWIQTSFGRKIQKAVEYREAGFPIAIIGEDHWADSLL